MGWYLTMWLVDMSLNTIWIPSSLDDEIAIVLEPPDKGFCFLADIFADTFDNGFVVGGGNDLQSFS